MIRNNKNLNKVLKLKSIYVPLITFFIIISIFFLVLSIERRQSIAEQRQYIQDQMFLIESKIDNELNQRIRSTMGITTYIKINPDITFDEFNNYTSLLVGHDDQVIRNISILKDTTIIYVYPNVGNENAIGIDLAEVPDQRDGLLYVRDSGVTLMTPPTDLVQGGQGIIVRIPIYLDDKLSNYWGQVGMVIDFDELIEKTGITELQEKYNLSIEQYSLNNVYQHQIISSSMPFSENSSEITIALPHVKWIMKADMKGNYPLSNFFYFILFLGFVLSLAIPYGIHNIYITNENLNSKVEERTKKLFETNEYLEQSMGELEEQQAHMILLNNQLQDSLDSLEETQHQLILNEKLASLGELVASVSHEINTPLGICVTLSTYLQENVLSLKEKLDGDNLTRSDLVDITDDSLEAMRVIILNLLRASDLVSSFKMVAVDQHLDDYRMINFKNYITDVTKSLSPKIKKTSHTLTLDLPEDIDFYTFPGALSQIITNLVMNSLLHGFKEMENGLMNFSGYTEDNNNIIVLEYTDNGKGIPTENIEKVFNPFFTTGKSSGSTGLGLHIIHNLIIQMLKGRITLESKENEGVKFTIFIPYAKDIDPDMIDIKKD